MGEYGRAQADFTVAILSNPQNAYAFSRRGMLHLEQGVIDRAKADISMAFLLKPSSPFVLRAKQALEAREAMLQ